MAAKTQPDTTSSTRWEPEQENGWRARKGATVDGRLWSSEDLCQAYIDGIEQRERDAASRPRHSALTVGVLLTLEALQEIATMEKVDLKHELSGVTLTLDTPQQRLGIVAGALGGLVDDLEEQGVRR